MGRKAQVRFLGGWARATASGNPTDQMTFSSLEVSGPISCLSSGINSR